MAPAEGRSRRTGMAFSPCNRRVISRPKRARGFAPVPTTSQYAHRHRELSSAPSIVLMLWLYRSHTLALSTTSNNVTVLRSPLAFVRLCFPALCSSSLSLRLLSLFSRFRTFQQGIQIPCPIPEYTYCNLMHVSLVPRGHRRRWTKRRLPQHHCDWKTHMCISVRMPS